MQTFEDHLSFEKKKHQEFFLPYYKSRGWEIIDDNIVSNRTTSWDVRVKNDIGVITIDEKARTGVWNDLLVEVLQDVETGNLGWVYKFKDYYLYGMWEDEIKPEKLYWIDANKLKEFVGENFMKFLDNNEYNISEKGWGKTFFITAKWNDLEYLKIAELL